MKVIKNYNYWKIKMRPFTGIFQASDYFIFYKNGKYHREDGPAIQGTINSFYYNGIFYGFTNKMWKKLAKKIKREQSLNIFK